MRLGIGGESGKIVLYEYIKDLVKDIVKNNKLITIWSLLLIIGIFFLVDLVLTISISVLSSVEGINLLYTLIKSWYFLVFLALIISYMGQDAFYILSNFPKLDNSILFEMSRFLLGNFYIIFLLISILARIIASQAVISATFSFSFLILISFFVNWTLFF